MILFLSAVLLIALYYLINRAYKNTKDIIINRIQINHHQTNEHAPILNILQLSDLHLENISISPIELYEKVKDEKIDLIAITGDFLDRKRSIPRLMPYLETLNQLDVKYGKYAVFGNHDYVLKKDDLQVLQETLEQYNFNVMKNENSIIDVQGIPVNIIGVDDFSTGRSDLSAAYKGIRQGTNLVLTHDPNLVLDMKQYHFDYLMAGHFHGGQICYPKAYHLVKMGKLVRMNMIKGMHIHDEKPFYINEGLGQTGVNIRVGSRPEITLHQLSLRAAESRSQYAM
ncbi:metallophosphoesterase [Bacillus sp. CECT 9360]|uniref:metallophosphoesterase n=1 Tax=Bacillus sp. CECT 9360 TaxID=2845821 RepID=UPI001E435431|nr:metallophosphoesterase [Bacillus sp. CECT 9360]CAH0347463.1 putative protein YpbG [Bacillus sp. CECT 9360]